MPVQFSIIVPVYNCANYLEECVAGILAQSESAFELLLIDDGAQDESGAICDSLAERDARIRVFHKENGGAASARNYGLDRARGRYVLFIDGDDLVERDLLERVSRELRENRLIVYGMAFDYYAGETVERTELMSAAHRGVFSTEAFAADFRGFFHDNALSSACNKVFDLELIQNNKLRYQDGMDLYEDFAFVLRYLALVREVCCLDEGLYHYRLSVGDNHLHKRVYQIDSLERNMDRLFEAAASFGDSISDRGPLSRTMAELYLQLLSLHLFLRHYGPKALAEAAVPYCGSRSFRQFLTEGAELGQEEASLLRQIDTKRFGALSVHYRKRYLRSQIRKMIKNTIRSFR